MPRKIVSSNELIRWLNSAMAGRDECEHCQFTSVARLVEDDHEGCNWSSPNLRCSGGRASICAPAANGIVEQARARFNIE